MRKWVGILALLAAVLIGGAAPPAPRIHFRSQQFGSGWAQVWYGRCLGEKKGATHFSGNVCLLILPAGCRRAFKTPDEALAQDLPAGALYLRADRLALGQDVRCAGQVYVQTATLYARAEWLGFHRTKGHFILVGSSDNPATLCLTGLHTQTIEGQRLVFDLKTLDVRVGRPSVTGE